MDTLVKEDLPFPDPTSVLIELATGTDLSTITLYYAPGAAYPSASDVLKTEACSLDVDEHSSKMDMLCLCAVLSPPNEEDPPTETRYITAATKRTTTDKLLKQLHKIGRFKWSVITETYSCISTVSYDTMAIEEKIFTERWLH